MRLGTFKRQGQSRISKRWGQTNEIIAELTNYHHFHSLTACNIYGIMVLVRFIVVFVWEAFALWSHLLKHIAHPLECIMEMKSLLLLCMCVFFFNISPDMTSCCFFFLCWCCISMIFVFFFYTEEGERGEKTEVKRKRKKESMQVFIQG